MLTVLSAAILIGAEVFGGAFAAGWAFANLFHLGGYAVHILQGVFFLCGVAVMVRFVHERAPRRAFHRGLTASRRARALAPPIYRFQKFS